MWLLQVAPNSFMRLPVLVVMLIKQHQPQMIAIVGDIGVLHVFF